MSFQRLFSTVLFGSALVLGALTGGCVSPSAPSDTDTDVEDVGESEQALDPDIFIISLNSLPPGVLMDRDYQGMMASLASGPLGTATPLADTRLGRTLLAYIAVCALPATSEVTIPGTTTDGYRYKGHIGLAQGWETGALSSTDKRWISACLLAHANTYGRAVEIDLIGNHNALVPSNNPDFDQEEAGFYGDLFQTGEAFACVGASASDPDGPPARVCGRTSECNFNITGPCLGVDTVPAVCADGPRYSDCITRDPNVFFDEVITVFTREHQFGNDKKCSHLPDEVGWPLDRACSTTAADVCAADPYCCDVDWDAACVDLALSPGF